MEIEAVGKEVLKGEEAVPLLEQNFLCSTSF